MTRARKLTLTVKEFSHLVSESLDLTNVSPSPLPLVQHTPVFSESPKKSRPSFQRIFSRPTPTPGQEDEDSPQGPSCEAPRSKMNGWPFSRSPRKNHPIQDEDDDPTGVNDPDVYHATSPYSVSSPAVASTSSLGSLVPAHERLFELASRDADEPARDRRARAISSSSVVINVHVGDPMIASGCYCAANPVDVAFGNGSATGVLEPVSGISSQTSLVHTSFESTDRSHSVTLSEHGACDEDPTPRASTFGARTSLSSAVVQDNALLVDRTRPQRPSLTVPTRDVDMLAMRPAIGVIPHAPSETESTVSACSTSSQTSTIARSSSPTFPTTKQSEPGASSPRVPPSTPLNARISAMFPGIASSSNLEYASPLGFSPRQRRRAMSRSLTPPPLALPLPTGPLPAVPPVPPLPPLLSKMSNNANPQAAFSSPPRAVMVAGAPANPASALPPSSAGGLRLPSRLSWVNSVRAVLPSPPASPTKSLRSLAGKTEKTRPHALKRPTSIGVIEAADNNNDAQVRRTKSILLFGSRSKSKSSASLGTKRVQIHADVPAEDATPTAAGARKPRRKSSAATIGHPPFSSILGCIVPSGGELLVPRERRHSAPVLSSAPDVRGGACADWTLSLPFCTDVPGNTILSPLSTPEPQSERGLEEGGGEDWTLCMPLKFRADTPTIGSTEGPDSECTTATTNGDDDMVGTMMQLPTPSPSPTWRSPASVERPLSDVEQEQLEQEEQHEAQEEEEERAQSLEDERPASLASLGPHVGGLDLAGGRGKRASGWHVYGWFDEVGVPEDDGGDADKHSIVAPIPMPMPPTGCARLLKSHVTAFHRKTQTLNGRHPSQDSVCSVSTSEATYYSARSSLLVN